MNLRVAKPLTGATTAFGVRVDGQIQSGVTSATYGFQSTLGTQATAFTLANLYHYVADGVSLGAGSTVTNQNGFIVGSNAIAATNNFGFRGLIPAGTGRWNLYMDGTADNYIAGILRLNTTTAPACTETSRLQIEQGGGAAITMSRATNDDAGPRLFFSKTRATAAGGVTIVSDGDLVGTIGWEATDGVQARRAATLQARVDGAPSAGSMPGRLEFLTTNTGSVTPTVRMQIDRGGTTYIGAAPGAESLRVVPVASAVNYLQATGGATGGGPTISAQGSDANIPLRLLSKGTSSVDLISAGTGPVNFYTNNSTLQFRVSHTASAVNYIVATGNVTGGAPYFIAGGSDTNVSMLFASKGTGVLQFVTAGGTEQFRVTHTASAVNWVSVTGGATGVPAYIRGAGEATTGLVIDSGGTGALRLTTGGSQTNQLVVTHTASAVNWVNVTGSVTTGTPIISCAGSDANVNLAIRGKGDGGVFIQPGGLNALAVVATASAVNYWQMTGAPTGNSLTSYAQGTDANIGMFFIAKGTGSFNVCTGGTTSNRQLLVANTASAVNYVQVTGAATGGAPAISAQGSDTNIGVVINSKGTGNVILSNDGGWSLVAEHATSAVNYVAARGAAAGSPPSLSAKGSDTNIDLQLTPKGTGLVRYGTYTNTALTITGYIEIKDAAGNVRKLAVVA